MAADWYGSAHQWLDRFGLRHSRPAARGADRCERTRASGSERKRDRRRRHCRDAHGRGRCRGGHDEPASRDQATNKLLRSALLDTFQSRRLARNDRLPSRRLESGDPIPAADRRGASRLDEARPVDPLAVRGGGDLCRPPHAWSETKCTAAPGSAVESVTRQVSLVSRLATPRRSRGPKRRAVGRDAANVHHRRARFGLRFDRQSLSPAGSFTWPMVRKIIC